MASVAYKDCYSYIGLDLEKTNRLSSSAMKRITHPLEVTMVAGNQLNASILFSLKEAFFKAQFPHWHTVGSFRELALSLDFDEGTANIQQLDLRFAKELNDLSLAFEIVDEYVLSLVWS